MRENMILNGKIKIKFLYGNKIPFRLRIDEHALDRMAERQKESGETKMSIIGRLLSQISKDQMQTCPYPEDGDKPIYFLEDTGEVFLCLIRRPFNAVENVTMDLIVSSYLIKTKEIVAHYQRNKCISFRKNGVIEYGANRFFRRVG